MKMMTRKRGRASISSSDPNKIELLKIQTTSTEKTRPGQTEPPKEVSLDHCPDLNLFGLDDFSWVLDEDALSPLGDVDQFCGLSSDGCAEDPDFEVAVSERTSQKRSADQKADVHGGNGINKNAIAARLNRQKKKEYVSGLENKVGVLTSENQVLKQENGYLNKRVEELENETRYLRAVLANDSMLGQLLSRLSGVNGMKFSTSLFQGLEKNDHDYAIPKKRVKSEEAQPSGGVCLHVDKDHVSVEFCTKCAESASATLKMWRVLPRTMGPQAFPSAARMGGGDPNRCTFPTPS